MNWVFGITGQAPGFKAELLSSGGAVSRGDLAALHKDGIPSVTRRTRVAYEGDFSEWSEGDAGTYLFAEGFENWPVGVSNRHQVFEIRTAGGQTLHVPALVLMRAFFRPTRHVFPVAFKPSNVALLSFVDYSGSKPRVVVDDVPCARQLRRRFESLHQASAINWMQMSHSAQRMVRSVHTNAALGWLNMAIPKGRVEMTFFGWRSGNDVFVTSANLLSVVAPHTDTISADTETFIFNGLRGQREEQTAMRFVVPMRADGQVLLTPEEWQEVEPLLRPKRPGGSTPFYSRCDVLNHILLRMVSSRSRSLSGTRRRPVCPSACALPSVSESTLQATYYRWKLEGKIELIISKLIELRTSGVEPPRRTSW